MLGSVPARPANLSTSQGKRPRSREEEDDEQQRLNHPVKRHSSEFDTRHVAYPQTPHHMYPDYPAQHFPPHFAPHPYPHHLRPSEYPTYLPQRSSFARHQSEGGMMIHRPTTAPAGGIPGHFHYDSHQARHYPHSREGPSRLAYQYGHGADPPYHLPVPLPYRPRERYESGMRHSRLSHDRASPEEERSAYGGQSSAGETRPSSGHHRTQMSTSPTRPLLPTAGYSMSRSHRPASGSGPRLPSLAEVIPHEEAMYSLPPSLSPRSHAAHSLTLYRSGRLSEEENENLRDSSEAKPVHNTGSLHSLLNPAEELTGSSNKPFLPEQDFEEDIKPDIGRAQNDMEGLEAG